MSQTQLANFSALAGLVVLILSQFNVVLPKENVIFILAAVWSVGSIVYNYYQRYKKGDLTLGGFKK